MGVGFFGRAALTDGQANPIHRAASGGVGGKGMFSGRPDDGFGIGYFYSGIAGTQITLTPDVQWIQPSQDRANDSWFVGLRRQ